MKTLSSITVFICSSSRRRLFARTSLNTEVSTISHFSTSSPDSSTSSSYHSSSGRNSDDVKNVRVSVWWDFENCQIPCNVNVYRVTQCITSAVRSVGIKGPIQITAIGDVVQLSRSNQEALSSTGVNLTHVPNGGKNSADRALLVDLMIWVSQNPPPAHLFIISGDKDFAYVLHRLRMSNYNILLASTDNAPAVLCSAASIMWQWTPLVNGENVIARHFNQPPDGPYGSRYGGFRAPLEDPFLVCNQFCSSENGSDEVKRPIPKAVKNVIRNILNIHPKGLSITELRAELGKSNVTIEKDLYGHKKFSRFLLAMPQLLRLQLFKDGQYIIHGVSPKSHETCVSTSERATGSNITAKDSVPVVASKEDGGHNTSMPSREEIKPTLSKLNQPKLSTESQALPEKQEELQHIQQQPPLEKEKEDEASFDRLYLVKMKRPTPEVGIFKSLWKKWFQGNDDHQEKISHAVNKNSPHNSTDTVNGSKDQSSDQQKPTPFSSSSNEVIQDAATDLVSAKNVDKASKHHGFFNKIVSWCKFWKSNYNSDNFDAEPNRSDKEMMSLSKMQEIFTDSFWNEMLAFLQTPRGSASILESKTRLEMVQNLQRLGPSRLRSLSESHILHLVGSLISEKKWVVESPSHTFPFRLVEPSGTIKSKDSTKQSKELTGSDTNPQENQVVTSVLPVKKNASPKTRNLILRDCQKLVNEVIKEYPNGFNISCFKKLFLEKYNYPLDVQQLGYQKLTTLLQIMPGVKLESNYILPEGSHLENASPTMEDCSSSKSDFSRTDDDSDTQWEELGPISTKKHDDFEPVSDTEISDSEEESSQNQTKQGVEDSSLLQILDSWYGNKEDSNGRMTSEAADHSNDDQKSSSLSGELGVSFEQKQKPIKRYSFVTDSPKSKEEDLINGILGSLKKPKIEG